MTTIEQTCPCGAKAVVSDELISRAIEVVDAFIRQHIQHADQKPGGSYS